MHFSHFSMVGRVTFFSFYPWIWEIFLMWRLKFNNIRRFVVYGICCWRENVCVQDMMHKDTMIIAHNMHTTLRTLFFNNLINELHSSRDVLLGAYIGKCHTNKLQTTTKKIRLRLLIDYNSNEVSCVLCVCDVKKRKEITSQRQVVFECLNY